ncbi:MAG: N-6 DNA methylase [Clostridia bacterium]
MAGGLTMNISLQKRIDTIFDHLYASSNIKNPETIAFEFSKLLHTGIFIEEKDFMKPAFKDFLPIESNGLFKQLSTNIDLIREKYLQMNQEWGLYKQENSILFSDDDINYICSILFDLTLTNKNIDILGDALEIFRNYTIKSLGGQFFTDPIVTKLAVDIIDYSVLKGESFIDICSGTGGFLLAAINKAKKDIESNSINSEGTLANIVINQISGKEIDSTVCNAANRNIQTRLGLNFNYVEICDSLKIDKSHYDKYDCIATNPPFGTKTTIKDENLLINYELALRPGSRQISPTPPDILFLEKNIQLLKPEDGRLAIVLPYQILSGPKAYYIRKWILEKCKIIAVIDLPAETFQPHTGTKTSLLILSKRKHADIAFKDQNYSIFMSKPKWIGHDRRGHSIYKKNPDGSTSSELLCDFDQVLKDWLTFKNDGTLENGISYSINANTIANDESLRINALFYSEMKVIDTSQSGIQLKELVAKIFYPGRFKRHYVNSEANSVPFLGGSNITEHIVSTKKYLSKDDPHLAQLIVREGWILITRSGTTGIVSIVPKEWDGYAISEHVIRIVPDEKKENPNYIYAFLHSDYAKEQLSKQVFGSVIDEISPDSVGNLLVPTIDPKIKEEICNTITVFKKMRNESIVHFNNSQLLLRQIV